MLKNGLSSNFKNKAVPKKQLTSTYDQETFKDLFQNKFMTNYVESKREEDRSNWLTSNLLNKNRTFKNFINNNSNILRRFKQKEKLTVMRQVELREREIID